MGRVVWREDQRLRARGVRFRTASGQTNMGGTVEQKGRGLRKAVKQEAEVKTKRQYSEDKERVGG